MRDLSILLINLLLSTVTVVVQGETYFFHTNHSGAPTMMTDMDQNVVWKADYDPFGEATVEEDPYGDGQTVTNNLRLPGQYYDKETELHYNHFRYYDPSTGRYITSDPIGLLGGRNTYLYARANPIINFDRSGLMSFIFGGGGSAAKGLAVEGSLGSALSIDGTLDNSGFSTFKSLGFGGGQNISSDLFIGFQNGGISDINADSVNFNLVSPRVPVSVTVLTDINSGDVSGFTVGIGPSTTAGAVSLTLSDNEVTTQVTLRQMLVNFVKLVAAEGLNKNEQCD